MCMDALFACMPAVCRGWKRVRLPGTRVNKQLLLNQSLHCPLLPDCSAICFTAAQYPVPHSLFLSVHTVLLMEPTLLLEELNLIPAGLSYAISDCPLPLPLLTWST